MSLTANDLQEIRVIVRDEVESIVRPIVRDEVETIVDRKLETVHDTLETLQNDIREIYFMIAKLKRGSLLDNKFQKLSP